jgi:hypothetical protein
MESREESIEDIFEAYFSRFSIFRFNLDLLGAVTVTWGRIRRNRKRFLSRTCPSTIKYFIFHPCVIIEDKITSDRTPFSQKNGPSFMAENPKFGGSGGYFWPRRLNQLLKLMGMVYPIYPYDFNVKGFDL